MPQALRRAGPSVSTPPSKLPARRLRVRAKRTSAGTCNAPLRPAPGAARDSVAVRPAGADLLPDPRGAGRSGGGACRRQRDAGADRRDPPPVRARPAAIRAVRRLSRAGRATRFRRQRLFAPPGGARHQPAPAGHARADASRRWCWRSCSAFRSAPSRRSITTAGPTPCCASCPSAASRSRRSGSPSSCSSLFAMQLDWLPLARAAEHRA